MFYIYLNKRDLKLQTSQTCWGSHKSHHLRRSASTVGVSHAACTSALFSMPFGNIVQIAFLANLIWYDTNFLKIIHCNTLNGHAQCIIYKAIHYCIIFSLQFFFFFFLAANILNYDQYILHTNKVSRWGVVPAFVIISDKLIYVFLKISDLYFIFLNKYSEKK